MTHSPTIGFIGLGQAGWPMAANVLAGGLALRVGDLDESRTRRFLGDHRGARALDRAALEDVDVAITMLPDGHVVRDVLLAPGDGLAGALRPGSVVIDMSTSDPAGTRALGVQLAARGIVLLDAGMSIHVLGGAASRQITIMLGGDDGPTIDRMTPILATMAETIIRVGGLGSGHVVKALNNYISGANFMATVDAVVLGRCCEIDASTLLEALNASSARNFSTAFTLKEEGITRRYRSGFSLALFVKDMGIMLDVAAAAGLELPLCGVIRERLAEALAALDAGVDHTAALAYWERVAGFDDDRGAPGDAPRVAALDAGRREPGAPDPARAIRAIEGYVTAVGFLAARDALAVGRRHRLDEAVMLEVFNASTARNWGTTVALPADGPGNRLDRRSIEVLERDVAVASQLLARFGCDGRLCAVAERGLASGPAE